MGVAAGIAILIVSVVLSFVFSYVFPSIGVEYKNLNIFRSWGDPLMSLFYLYPFLLGIILSFAWSKVKSLLRGSWIRKSITFGVMYFIVAGIPGMFMTISSFQLSWQIVLSWTIAGLVEALAAGKIFAFLDRE